MLTAGWNGPADILRYRRIATPLVFGADPANRGVPPPTRVSAADLPLLIQQARAHTVLPAVLRNLWLLAESEPGYDEVLSGAAEHARLLAAHSLMLRGFADALTGDLAGEPVTLVKGLAFARAIYPDTQLRPFTDIDLLIAPQAMPRVEEVLGARGFAFIERDMFGTAKWGHRQNRNLMVELQRNLVQSRRLQPKLSLSFDDLAIVGPGKPAAHLMVAVIHGAAQHQFENLRQVVDILQAARGIASAADEEQLEKLVARTGGRLAAVASLNLAWRIFGEPRCRELARGLGPAHYGLAARLLLNRAAILSTSTQLDVCYRWRRHGLRELLKFRAIFAAPRSANGQRPSPTPRDAARLPATHQGEQP